MDSAGLVTRDYIDRRFAEFEARFTWKIVALLGVQIAILSSSASRRDRSEDNGAGPGRYPDPCAAARARCAGARRIVGSAPTTRIG